MAYYSRLQLQSQRLLEALTCARDADAMGTGSTSSNTSVIARPVSSANTACTCSQESRGAACVSTASVLTYSGGSK